jgi:hypothetical protein
VEAPPPSGSSDVGALMLVVAAFPTADLREFAQVEHPRGGPDWPPRADFPRQFLRSFGLATRRRRAVDAAAPTERTYWAAGRALRLSGFGASAFPVGTVAGRPRCAFRRALSDGGVRARVEVGLAIETPPKTAADVESIVAASLELRARVGAREPEGPLVAQGDRIAALYAAATRPADAPDDQGELVVAGRPVIVVEMEGGASPAGERPGWRTVPIAATRGATCRFRWTGTDRGRVATWLLETGESTEDARRLLRLCLFILHHEQETLDLVLRGINRRTIAYEPGTASGDRLEAYLATATRAIGRTAWGGLEQSAILAAFDASTASGDPDELGALASRLQGARGQIRTRTEAYLARRPTTVSYQVDGDAVFQNLSNVTTTGDISMRYAGGAADGAGDGGRVNVRQGMSGVTAGGNVYQVAAERIENAFNAGSSTAGDDLKAALAELQAQVKGLAKAAAEIDGPSADEIAATFEKLAREALDKAPIKEIVSNLGGRLVDAAKAVGEKIAPVTAAVSMVLRVLGVPIPF